MKRWAWLSAVLMNLMSVTVVQADESVAKLLATQKLSISRDGMRGLLT